MDFTTPVPERSGTPAQRSGPSTLQAGMASVDASSPLVGTNARKAKQAERLASCARVRSSIRHDLSGKDSSVPPIGSQQDAEQPAAEEDIEEGIPASTIKFSAAKLFNENVPEMSKDTEVLDIVYQIMPDGYEIVLDTDLFTAITQMPSNLMIRFYQTLATKLTLADQSSNMVRGFQSQLDHHG